ncbi:MAG TPA: aminopeptidase [Acidobacteriota bacterium]|nr:aminopeptidase [Acidobacteriota bacterium]
MKRGRKLAAALLGLAMVLALSSSPADAALEPVKVEAPEAQQEEWHPDWEALAETIARRLELQPDEKILLLTYPGRFQPLSEQLRTKVREAGAVDMGQMEVYSLAPPADASFQPDEAWRRARQAAREMLSEVDATLKLPGALPVHAPYQAVQDLLREGKGRTVHFHWEGAYDVDGNPLPITEAVSRIYERAVLETDYDAVAEAQRLFEQAMREEEVRVTTPAGSDIRFRIGDRPVTRQDGDASATRASQARNLIDREIELPCGAVRVAPLEESVSGTIVFPNSTWAGKPVRNLRMRFEQGRVTEWQAEEGAQAVQEEMAQAGDGSRAFREFALGFNPLLAVPRENPWIPYYGYGAGVVRLSLGDNTELGGNVGGGYVRWNFFVDADVYVGGQAWVKNGTLTVPR